MHKLIMNLETSQLEKLKKHFEPYLVTYEKEGVFFQAVRNNSRILVFNDGKIDINGPGAFAIGKDIDYFLNDQFYDAYAIACEGVNDVFGPIVFCLSHFTEENKHLIKKLNLDLSKKITDYQVQTIAPFLIKHVSNSFKVIDAKDYNTTLDKNFKKEQIFAHYAYQIAGGVACKQSVVIVDSFTNSPDFTSFNQNKKLLQGEFAFYDNASQTHYAAYISSIIARYVYLQKLNEYNQKLDVFLIKGNTAYTKEQYAELSDKFPDKIFQIAKKNYV